MSHLIVGQKKLLTRIRKIKGQSEALEKALESGDNCHKVLQQISAIRGAVNGLMKEVLEEHLREHLAAEELSQQERHDEVEQVITILNSYLK
jgi:DNA-binding FrmR family transcriptional regulator